MGIEKKYPKKKPLVCLTAYDYKTALIVDKYSDIVLVGDSLGMVLYGDNSTGKVTLDMMIRHGKSVRKGIKKSYLVVDMPKNTYNNPVLALKNAKKIIKFTKCDAVKLEGGLKQKEIIKNLINHNIEVVGHIGLLPQQHNGKYPVYGRKKNEEKKILNDLGSLEKAGVFSVVVECTIESVVKKLMKNSTIPIIGIGATSDCDGQVLVAEDLLGLTNFDAKFLKKYSNLNMIISRAFQRFSLDVVKRKYPQKKNYYK